MWLLVVEVSVYVFVCACLCVPVCVHVCMCMCVQVYMHVCLCITASHTTGSLLQKVNLDTQKCAYKCSYVLVDGKDVSSCILTT